MEEKEVVKEEVEQVLDTEKIMYQNLLQKSYAGIKFMLGSY